MANLSRRLEEAVRLVSALPSDQQNLIALEITERARTLASTPVRLTPQESAELAAELAAARRGELASEADVAAMYAKHGL